MRKIISFSLWGNNPKYCVGAIRNAQLALKHFTDWTCYFYYDDSVPAEYINILNDMVNCKTFKVDDGEFGAFWRFRAMKPDTIVLSRDCDSRLSVREQQIVDEWLSSDKKLSVIRDHVNHYEFPILAGMWGIKDGLDDEMISAQGYYSKNHQYLMDQFWLRDAVWPKLEKDVMIHGIKETMWMRSSYDSIGRDFIGQTYEENGNTVYNPALV